ncbi:hypothetical protein PHISP_07317 [Aspergillus sp. HF37]|nr:hypothetical protein PHISP_07317 [Aspergillus sp. HF37]
MSPSPTQIHNLELSDNETFPPLQNLSLSGYKIQSEEQVWRDKFPWQELRSLSLGVQDNPGFLELATGRLQGLTEFKITSYGSPNATEVTELDNFVSSFHNLESLTAKGTVPSLNAVAHHPNLRHLCLHAIEKPHVQRKTLDAKQIDDLNRLYPDLTSLEIDLDPDGTWPYDSIDSIAKGFKNLRQLSIHVGLGIARLRNEPIKPGAKDIFAFELTESTTKDFARHFFEYRGPSVLERITLETGEPLRWFPQWQPKYAELEDESAKTVVVYPPLRSGDEPRVNMEETSLVWIAREIELRIDYRFSDSGPPRLSRAPRII